MTNIINLLSTKMYNLKSETQKETQKIAYHKITGNKITLTTRPVSQNENDKWREAMKIFTQAPSNK